MRIAFSIVFLLYYEIAANTIGRYVSSLKIIYERQIYTVVVEMII